MTLYTIVQDLIDGDYHVREVTVLDELPHDYIVVPTIGSNYQSRVTKDSILGRSVSREISIQLTQQRIEARIAFLEAQVEMAKRDLVELAKCILKEDACVK